MSKGEVYVQTEINGPFNPIGSISRSGENVEVQTGEEIIDVSHGNMIIFVRDPASGTVLKSVYPKETKVTDVPNTESRILVIHGLPASDGGMEG